MIQPASQSLSVFHGNSERFKLFILTCFLRQSLSISLEGAILGSFGVRAASQESIGRLDIGCFGGEISGDFSR
jgi:hypothetical protein